MDRQATQPAAVPSGRKRRRVSKKQKQEEEAQARAAQMKADQDQEMAELGFSRAELLEMKAKQPPTNELVIALNALPKAYWVSTASSHLSKRVRGLGSTLWSPVKAQDPPAQMSSGRSGTS